MKMGYASCELRPRIIKRAGEFSTWNFKWVHGQFPACTYLFETGMVPGRSPKPRRVGSIPTSFANFKERKENEIIYLGLRP